MNPTLAVVQRLERQADPQIAAVAFWELSKSILLHQPPRRRRAPDNPIRCCVATKL